LFAKDVFTVAKLAWVKKQVPFIGYMFKREFQMTGFILIEFLKTTNALTFAHENF